MAERGGGREAGWAWRVPPLLPYKSLALLFLLFLAPHTELCARAVTWKCQLLPKAGDWPHGTPLPLKGCVWRWQSLGGGGAGVSHELGTFLPPAGGPGLAPTCSRGECAEALGPGSLHSNWGKVLGFRIYPEHKGLLYSFSMPGAALGAEGTVA